MIDLRKAIDGNQDDCDKYFIKSCEDLTEDTMLPPNDAVNDSCISLSGDWNPAPNLSLAEWNLNKYDSNMNPVNDICNGKKRTKKKKRSKIRKKRKSQKLARKKSR